LSPENAAANTATTNTLMRNDTKSAIAGKEGIGMSEQTEV